MSDDRQQKLKSLFLYFRKPKMLASQDSQDYSDLSDMLNLNGQLAVPKGINTTVWALVTKK
jgi:hypothetical protein